jgi:hypothetical protein
MPVEIVKFREYRKNTLQGFLTVLLQPSGLEIRDCTVHQKGDKRWIGMPAKPYQDDSGDTKYSLIVYFPDRDRSDLFQKAALAAFDRYRPPAPPTPPVQLAQGGLPGVEEDDGLPF